MSKPRKVNTLILLAASFLTVIFLQKSDLHAQTDLFRSVKRSSESDITTDLKALSRIPSIGFHNIAANYTFIQFLLYFGDDNQRKHTGYTKSPDFFEVIIHHDPHYKDFYLFLSQSTSVYAGMYDRAIKITDEGLTSLQPKRPSDAYYVWRYKGIDELLFKGDNKSAQHSFETAATWAEISNTPESQDISERSRRTAQFLAEDPDSRSARISAWTSVFFSALDSQTRERAVEEIRDLGGEVTFGENGSVRVRTIQSERTQTDQNIDS